MNRQKGFSQIAIILIAIGVLALGAGIFYFSQKSPAQNAPGELEQQAKTPPVSSTAPITSPSSSTSPAKQPAPAQNAASKTFTDNTFGFTFNYPSILTVYVLNSTSTGKLEPQGGALYLNTTPPASPLYAHPPFLTVVVRVMKPGQSYADGSATREELTRLIQDFKDSFEVTYKTIPVAGYQIQEGTLVSTKDSLPEVIKGQKTFAIFIARHGILYQFSTVQDIKRGVTEAVFDRMVASLAFSK